MTVEDENENRIRVLVVDDHTIFRDGVRTLLNLSDDIEVIGEASDGQEAIGKVQELNPDVVLMDFCMPHMDGLEATRLMIKQHLNVKILMLTQYDDREHIISSIRAGASGYIPKNAASSELVSAIHTVYRNEVFLCPSAVSVMIEDYQRKDSEDPYEHLTTREREILRLIAEGSTSIVIARELSISLKTVLGHRAKLMKKLALHNKTELIRYAIRKGLVGN